MYSSLDPCSTSHQLHHHNTQSQSQQPQCYRRTAAFDCHDNGSSLSSSTGTGCHSNAGGGQQMLGSGYRGDISAASSATERHQTLGEFLPSSSSGSCRQSALSYTSRYQQQQLSSSPFYDTSSYDFTSLGGTMSEHPPAAERSCSSRSFQPQPAHCGGGLRSALGLQSAGGPLASWVVDERPENNFRSTQNTSNEMTSASRGSACGVVKEEYSDQSDCSSSDTYSDQDWTSTRRGSESLGTGRGLIDTATTGGDCQSSDASLRPRLQPRRRGRDVKLTPEEDARRRVRRERNKLAAARCRQRRVDLTNQLLAETECLEDEKMRLEKEISNLQRQRNQLEFVLEAHVPRCHVLAVSGPGALQQQQQQPPAAHIQPPSTTSFSLPHPPHLTHRPPAVKVEQPDGFVGKTTTELPMTSSSLNYVTGGRPASLAISRPVAMPTSDVITPFDSLGLDCMIDGHTGLTPITGAPSCGGHRVTPDNDVTMNNELSPTTLMTL